MVKLSIGGVDKSASIDVNSVQLNRALTSQVDTLVFDVIRKDNTAYIPAILDEIELTDNDGVTVIFGGIIATIERVMEGGTVERVKCQCKDFSFLLDRKLVVETYEDMTVNDIIDDINTTYLTGFTIANVDCPTIIKFISFNYEYPSKCLQQLAELTQYNWYVDNTKDIHFFAASSTPAPFDLDDTGEKYFINSLKIKEDVKNLRNSIFVRGGTFKGDTFSETKIADGTQLTFTQMYRYHDVSVTVDAVSKTVGVDNLNDPADYDCLYNFQEKALKFKDSTKPAATKAVVITGLPDYPVLTKLTDIPSSLQYGVFEYKIADSSINSKEAARNRARAELSAWAQSSNEGSFSSKESGLEVGQLINVQSTMRDIEQDFVITRVVSKMRNSAEWVHDVILTTTQTFGIIEFLQQLITRKDKEIKVDANEVLDTVFNLRDEIAFSDSLAAPTTDSPPYTYLGSGNEGSWNFSTWS